MGVRKLGCLPPSASESADDSLHQYPGCGGSRTPGYRLYQSDKRKVQFAQQDIEAEKNYLEQKFLQRFPQHGTDHFEEAQFPERTLRTKSSYTYANSVCRHGDRISQVKVEDFLSACDVEVGRQKRRRCQKTTVLPLCPTECDPGEDCVSCQVAELKRDLKRRHTIGRWPACNLCYRYRSQRATMKDIAEAQSKAIPVCKKADVQGKTRGLKTPPPPPVSVMAIFASPAATPSPVPVGTPDSEYDTSKRDLLIKKYIPKRKLTHFECQPRGRVFFYTDDTANQGFVHQRYSFQGRQPALINTKRKKNPEPRSAYAVSHLGLVYAIPDHNPALPERQPSPPLRSWNKCKVLPPINVRSMDHVPNEDHMSPVESNQTGCSSSTCSC